MDTSSFGVLLIRKLGYVDGSFEYPGERLPEPDDEIDVADANGKPLRAKVTGVEKTKTRPIRAVEL